MQIRGRRHRQPLSLFRRNLRAKKQVSGSDEVVGLLQKATVKDNFAAIRIATSATALLLGCYAVTTLLAETMISKTRPSFFDLSSPTSTMKGPSRAERIASISPLRGDLIANVAFAYAGSIGALVDEGGFRVQSAARDTSLKLARQSLKFAPPASDVWLLLAALQRDDSNSKPAIEALKMSYLTAPGDTNLIPARLLLFSITAGAVGDPDLKDLARADIRAIITRRRDLIPTMVRAYQAGGPEAKAYFHRTLNTLDTDLAATFQ
jgi:hypothetical protein